VAILRQESARFTDRIAVAIAGGGACGLTAAIAAAASSADVLVLEQDSRLAGSTAMSLGAMCAAASIEHRRHGIPDSPALFYEDIMAKTEGRADARLARWIAVESGPTVDWLTNAHDVPLQLDFKWTSLGHSHPRLHMPPGRNGAELVALLERAATRAGAEVMLQARVRDLCVSADGAISGLSLERPDGSIEWLGVDALVLATCGYGGNHDLVAQHIPEMANGRYFGHEGNRGDALLWGEALGAATGDLSAYQGLGTLAEPQAIVVPHPLILEGGWIVNCNGERFTHENENISGLCVPVTRQPQSIAWVIFDEERHIACLAHSVEQRQLAEIGAIRRGRDLAELAARCDLPAPALQREAHMIDAARRTNKPDRFGRRFDSISPLSAGFCALRVTGALFHTQGGLVVDEQARVARLIGGVVPNLFAGGGAARSISGPEATGYLPGAGLCTAITMGRRAGLSAARQANSQGQT
jgi:fumarate reductase flavoprotein subunit